MKIAFIGGGNMGEAMLSAVLNKGLATPPDISISDVSESRRQHIVQEYGVYVTASNPEVLTRGDIVVLAIKPQNLAETMAELNGQLKPQPDSAGYAQYTSPDWHGSKCMGSYRRGNQTAKRPGKLYPGNNGKRNLCC